MHLGTLALAAALAIGAVARRDHLATAPRIAVGIVVAGLVISGTGLVNLPDAETIVRTATSRLGPATYAVVGGFAFAETGAFVGLVAPGEAVVVLGGVSAGHGTIALVPLIAVVWACALAGDLSSYALGRRLGRDALLRHGGAVGITDARLSRLERTLGDHLGKTVVLGRFVGLVRPLTPFLVGAAHTPPRRFLPLTVLASGVWSATLCSLGWAFWRSLDDLLAVVEQGSLAFAAVAAAAVAGVAVARRTRSRPSLRWGRTPWRLAPGPGTLTDVAPTPSVARKDA